MIIKTIHVKIFPVYVSKDGAGQVHDCSLLYCYTTVSRQLHRSDHRPQLAR